MQKRLITRRTQPSVTFCARITLPDKLYSATQVVTTRGVDSNHNFTFTTTAFCFVVFHAKTKAVSSKKGGTEGTWERETRDRRGISIQKHTNV